MSVSVDILDETLLKLQNHVNANLTEHRHLLYSAQKEENELFQQNSSETGEVDAAQENIKNIKFSAENCHFGLAFKSKEDKIDLEVSGLRGSANLQKRCVECGVFVRKAVKYFLIIF